MAKAKTFFEQVPIALALQIIEKDTSERSGPALCSICGIPVELENCKINETGKAVHGSCYFGRIARRRPSRVLHSTTENSSKRASR